jgi:hypothetical protein
LDEFVIAEHRISRAEALTAFNYSDLLPSLPRAMTRQSVRTFALARLPALTRQDSRPNARDEVVALFEDVGSERRAF